MGRREEMREKDRIRKQQEIDNFLGNVDKLYNSVDSILSPSVSIMREHENNYINYYVVKHPNSLKYHVSMYKKDYPFSMYRSSEYYRNDIPKKYMQEFSELEKYFEGIL